MISVGLAIVLGSRAWEASNEGYERGVHWFLVAAAAALALAGWWAWRRRSSMRARRQL